MKDDEFRDLAKEFIAEANRTWRAAIILTALVIGLLCFCCGAFYLYVSLSH